MNSIGYIVPFLIISSIIIDLCFINLIFIGAIFNSYNYWYLLSYSNQFTLHYSILLLIIIILIILFIYYYYFKVYWLIERWITIEDLGLTKGYKGIINNKGLLVLLLFNSKYYYYYLFSLILSSFFCNFTFLNPIFLDFFLIFSTFFFKGPINSIEVFTGFNPYYSILFINFLSLFLQIQFIILLLIINNIIFSYSLHLIILSFLHNTKI